MICTSYLGCIKISIKMTPDLMLFLIALNLDSMTPHFDAVFNRGGQNHPFLDPFLGGIWHPVQDGVHLYEHIGAIWSML
jgi:hypothetical protein